MGQIIKILNPEFMTPANQRTREWLELGETKMVGRFVLTVERVLENEVYSVELVAMAADHDRVERVCLPHLFNFVALGVPVVMAPKAIELDAMGRPVRVLLEFCGVDVGALNGEANG